MSASPEITYILLRHGATKLHGTNRIAGGLVDVSLSSDGHQQVIDFAASTKNQRITSVDASHLVRAQESGAHVAQVHGITGVTPDSRVGERRYGTHFEEETDPVILQERQRELWDFWTMPPAQRLRRQLVEDMEPDECVLERTDSYLYDDRERGERVVVGTHGDLMSTYVLHRTGLLVSPDYTGVVYVRVKKQRSKVVGMERVKIIKDFS
jgi:broad specificity phosphatase PhoE